MRGTPVLYLRGVSMGDVQEALAAVLGRDAPNLPPSVMARLRAEWGTIRSGNGVICRPGATSTSGPVASISSKRCSAALGLVA